MFSRTTLIVAAFACLVAAQDRKPQFEMTHYVVGFFHKGPNWRPPSRPMKRAACRKRIWRTSKRLAEAGKLIVAGPFGDNGDLRGMLIFKLESVDEARKLMDADPTLKAGRLTLDLHPWFAAAGLRVNAPKSAP
jgi:uncharacterized protein